MSFRIEYDHDKFLELCCQPVNIYMIENRIIECLKAVYFPENTPQNNTDNIVPWFWLDGAMALLIEIEKCFAIYFLKEETSLFTGLEGNETVTIEGFAKIIQKKLIETREGNTVIE